MTKNWLDFRILEDGVPRKTIIWSVRTKTDTLIGFIRWFPSWRKYTFHPEEKTLYDQACLKEIADFLEQQTKAHYSALRNAKTKSRTIQTNT